MKMAGLIGTMFQNNLCTQQNNLTERNFEALLNMILLSVNKNFKDVRFLVSNFTLYKLKGFVILTKHNWRKQ